jgi:hypothetical protein
VILLRGVGAAALVGVLFVLVVVGALPWLLVAAGRSL